MWPKQWLKFSLIPVECKSTCIFSHKLFGLDSILGRTICQCSHDMIERPAPLGYQLNLIVTWFSIRPSGHCYSININDRP
jgi:hypothetical protein